MTTKAPIRIFIVDDHTLVREWLSSLLRHEVDFIVCGQADSAAAALEGIKAAAPDIALVDLSLKNGSGLDLLKDLRSPLPRGAGRRAIDARGDLFHRAGLPRRSARLCHQTRFHPSHR